MLKINLFLLILPIFAMSQTKPITYRIISDSVRISTIDNSGSELIIENSTKDTIGVLCNIGNGRTEFISVKNITCENSIVHRVVWFLVAYILIIHVVVLGIVLYIRRKFLK